jgi:hypothetical protein
MTTRQVSGISAGMAGSCPGSCVLWGRNFPLNSNTQKRVFCIYPRLTTTNGNPILSTPLASGRTSTVVRLLGGAVVLVLVDAPFATPSLVADIVVA